MPPQEEAEKIHKKPSTKLEIRDPKPGVRAPTERAMVRRMADDQRRALDDHERHHFNALLEELQKHPELNYEVARESFRSIRLLEGLEVRAAEVDETTYYQAVAHSLEQQVTAAGRKFALDAPPQPQDPDCYRFRWDDAPWYAINETLQKKILRQGGPPLVVDPWEEERYVTIVCLNPIHVAEEGSLEIYNVPVPAQCLEDPKSRRYYERLLRKAVAWIGEVCFGSLEAAGEEEAHRHSCAATRSWQRTAHSTLDHGKNGSTSCKTCFLASLAVWTCVWATFGCAYSADAS